MSASSMFPEVLTSVASVQISRHSEEVAVNSASVQGQNVNETIKAIASEEVRNVRELPDLMDRINQMGLTDEYISFRQRYQGWRRGEHHGAEGELTVQDMKQKRGWGFWYPNLSVWRWRRTMSYWIAVTFFEGAIFFTISSFLWCYPEYLGNLQRTVTVWGYVWGKINFVICTYLMCIETVNLSHAPGDTGSQHHVGGNSDAIDSENGSSALSVASFAAEDEKWKWWPFHCRTAIKNLDALGVGPWPYYASVIYFIGVLTFGIGLIADFMPEQVLPTEAADWTGLISFLFGSLFFVLGGAFECIENRVFVCGKVDQGFIGAFFNLLGGIGFFIGAILGFLPGMSYWSLWWYGVGSVVFVLGSAVMIIMWKDEQFGLTFLAVLNHLGDKSGRPFIEKDEHEDKDNTMSITTAIFINVYVVTGVLSIYNFMISFATAPTTRGFAWVIECSFNNFLPCIFAHYMLALNSSVYRTPRIAPFYQLYNGCRCLAVLMCINSGTRFVQALQWAYCVSVGECSECA